MRGLQLARYSFVALVLIATMASGTSAAEAVCQCFEADVAGRVVGQYSGFSSDLRIEGAFGLPEYAASAWLDVHTSLVPISMFGGQLLLTRDWLSVGIIAQQDEAGTQLSIQGQAMPSSWLLVEGTPTVIGGITALVTADPFTSDARGEIILTPSLTGVIAAGSTTVSPSIGFDLGLDSESQMLAITTSRLASTVNAGCVLIANTVHFTGLIEAFSSLVVSVSVPDWGLTISGSLLPTGNGGFSYRISLAYEWGDTYLLSIRSEKPETVCTGGVCF